MKWNSNNAWGAGCKILLIENYPTSRFRFFYRNVDFSGWKSLVGIRVASQWKKIKSRCAYDLNAIFARVSSFEDKNRIWIILLFIYI